MIYLDFEGFIKETPSLVGYKIDGKFTQLILDEDLSLISEETDINFMDFEEFCHEIIARSNKTKEPIVAWSDNELFVFKEFQENIHYCNLLQVAKKQIKKNKLLVKTHKEMPEYWVGQRITRTGRVNNNNNAFLKKRWDLVTILKLLDYPSLSTGYGKGKVTARLSAIKKGLNARGSYKRLTAVQKAKWTKLKQHNFVDVDGMEYIVKNLDISME